MYTRFLNLVATFLLSGSWMLAADDPKYPVSEIPDSLKANAMAVIRNSLEVFEIKSEGRGTYSQTIAITVLNENGLDEAIWIQPYSQKLHRINSIKGTIYDAAGKKVESLTQDKVIDQSMIAGYSLYEDTRVKYFRPRTMTYPFTAEYSFDIEFDGLFNMPDWTPVTDYNISVQKSAYRIICPAGKQVRYFANRFAGQPAISNENGATVYQWELANITAYEKQPFSGPFTSFSPMVQMCPGRFEIEGYSGDFNTWDDFGKWINSVNAGRNTLPEATIQQVKDLVKDCKTEIEKADKIYRFMQAKTRYLNVSVGIGGWQPVPAETVDRLGYGDCKALSNYMVALLDAAGIKAKYTLIRAGENVPEPNNDFPNNDFNHAIVCLPLPEDTLWLECTSQQVPFGYLGTFTDNRNALVVDENGSKLIRTKSYSVQDNQLIRNTLLNLDIDGYAVLKTSTIHNGVLYDDKLGFYIAGSDDRKRMVHDELNIPGCILGNISYEEKHELVPSIKEDIEMDIPRYGTISGSRMLVSLIPVGRLRDVPKKVTNRRSEVVIKRSIISTDSVFIAVPEGYIPEAIPAEINTQSSFGTYSLKTSVQEGNKVLCVRKLITREGRYDSQRYNELVDFYKKIAVSDNQKISLKKSI